MIAIRDASNLKRWYQLSVGELILGAAVAAVIAHLSIVGRDIGSGVSIVVYGFPLPFLTDHSVFGGSVNGIALSVDVVLWIFATAALILAVRKIRPFANVLRGTNGG